MAHGRSWKVEPVSFPDVRALTAALGVSERSRPARAARARRSRGGRAFLEPEGITHDPFLLGDMAAAVERIRARSSAASGSASTATTTSTGSAPPRSPSCAAGARRRCRLAPPEPVRGGLRRLRRDDRAPRRRGRAADLTVDCGITAVDEVEQARRLGVDMIVTDHHRPGETLPDCPIVATRPVRRTRSPSSAAPVSSPSSRRRSSAPTILPSRAMPTSSRSPRSPTSSRSSTRTARSRPPACAALPARRSRASAR